ncbi:MULTISPECIES: hypothetical protein [Achromobacter]|nr:hypothetical protein [Achromobacter anxifer]MDF8362054.1 hypothetical protein [Achromobacter anxifer]
MRYYLITAALLLGVALVGYLATADTTPEKPSKSTPAKKRSSDSFKNFSM